MDLEQRSEFFLGASEHSPYAAVRTRFGATFVLRTHDRHVGRSLFAKGGRGEMGVIGRAVQAIQHFHGVSAIEGTTFLDVGANVGTSIVTALVIHPFADGVAIEPEQQNYETLKLNIAVNELHDRVVCLQMAISDRSGSAELAVDTTESGKHWIATEQNRPALAKENWQVITVPTLALDDLAEMGVIEADRVGLIWIDAQAHEGHILDGATRLTDRGCPTVFEWDPKSLAGAGDLDRLKRVLVDHYTHFIDMRKNPDPTQPVFELRPSDAIDAFSEPFLGTEASRRFTDILALRVDPEQALQTDLTEVFGARRPEVPA